MSTSKKANKTNFSLFDEESDNDGFMEVESSIEDDSTEDDKDIVSPFDPKDIKIIIEPKTIDHLVTRLRYDEIDLNTEFQRKGNLWAPDAQSRLIESILLRLPLPAFYFDAGDDNKWLVVDGLQRLWTIKNFVVNAELNDAANAPLKLTGLEILKDYSGRDITYNKLSRAMQRRILETPITTYLIQPGTPKEVKYNVFRRINTGGLGLNSMEIRHALNQGRPTKFLKDLSENPELTEVLKVQDKRMQDKELLLRAISFINKDYTAYEKPLSTFLDKAMEQLSSYPENELKILEDKIIDSVLFQKELFGKHLFSRSIIGEKIRVRLNSALFEVWVSLVSRLNYDSRSNLKNNKESLIEEYKEALKSEKLMVATISSTSSKGSVRNRFEIIGNIISKYSK